MTAPHRLPAETLARKGAVTMPQPSPEQIAREEAQVAMLQKAIDAINCACGGRAVYFDSVKWQCVKCWGGK